MNYCRFSDGDVYMFSHVLHGYIICSACSLADKSVDFQTNREALTHLLEHQRAGHTVPQYAIDRLLEEIGPMTDWEILGQAIAECKRAFWDVVTAALSPVLDAVVRFLDALERWLK